MTVGIEMWTVFHCPLDFPGEVVIRRFVATSGHVYADAGEPVARFASQPDGIEKARAWARKRGLTCLGRMAQDEPQIVETWMRSQI